VGAGELTPCECGEGRVWHALVQAAWIAALVQDPAFDRAPFVYIDEQLDWRSCTFVQQPVLRGQACADISRCGRADPVLAVVLPVAHITSSQELAVHALARTILRAHDDQRTMHVETVRGSP